MGLNMQQKASHACKCVLASLSHLVLVQAVYLAETTLSQPPCLQGAGTAKMYTGYIPSDATFHGLENPGKIKALALTCLWVLSTVSTVLGHAPGCCLSCSQKWIQIGPCRFVETGISELCYEDWRSTTFIHCFYLFIIFLYLYQHSHRDQKSPMKAFQNRLHVSGKEHFVQARGETL